MWIYDTETQNERCESRTVLIVVIELSVQLSAANGDDFSLLAYFVKRINIDCRLCALLDDQISFHFKNRMFKSIYEWVKSVKNIFQFNQSNKSCQIVTAPR